MYIIICQRWVEATWGVAFISRCKCSINYDRAKRNYTETKELHRANTPQDKEAKMRGLEDYFKEISSDITGMLSDMTPEERNMLKSKISALATKL